MDGDRMRRDIAQDAAMGVPLSGVRTRLAPMTDAHVEDLHAIATSGPAIGEWPCLGKNLSVVEFYRELWAAGSMHFAIERTDSDAVIGLVHAVEPNFRNLTVGIGMMLAPDLWRSGWPLEAVVTYVDYLFVGWRFRKLYFRVSGSGVERIGSAIGLVLERECVQRDHFVLAQGATDDLYTLALQREVWERNEVRLMFGRRPASPGATT